MSTGWQSNNRTEPTFSTSSEIKGKLGLQIIERTFAPNLKRHGGSCGWNGKAYGRRRHMEHWATGSRPFLPPHRPNIIKRSSGGHVPRSILSPRRKEKKIGSDYWCVMESSQRVSAGREDCKAGASTKNFEAPWAYAVVTFLHKDVFKQPTRLDWTAQYSTKLTTP